MRRRRLTRALAILAVAAALTACGGTGGGTGSHTPRPTPSRRPTPTPTPDPIAGMTLQQKLGQLVMVGFPGATLTPALQQAFATYRFGAVVLTQGNGNGADAAQVRQLIASIQGAEGAGPAPIVTTNQEGGTVCFYDTGMTCPPGQREQGAGGDPATASQDSAAMAKDLRALGFDSGLAPVADVWDGQSPFMADRSFGTDPTTVSSLVTAAIEADHAGGIIAVAKHFPGHGSAADSHVSLPTVSHDMATLQRVDLPPFEAAIKAGVDMVMVGHLLVPAIDPDQPTSASPKAMSLLRDQLGFKGVILTDDLQMDGIQVRYQGAQAGVAAFEAGADMLMFASSVPLAEQAISLLQQQVASGKITQARVDESVRRVMALKRRFGLLPGAPSPTPG
jgi:beta-N-acetylhexosaminidase